MTGFFPPNSNVVFLIVFAATPAICRPTSTLPVNEILLTYKQKTNKKKILMINFKKHKNRQTK
jgi:hypothetical protein